MHNEAEYMNQIPLLSSELSPIRPNFKLLKGNVNTRSSQAQPLYKIDKLVSIWGSFKPELSMLESCCTSQCGKGQRMFQVGTDQILEFSCNFLILMERMGPY